MKEKLWGGRFKKGMDVRLKEFSYSFATDHELLCAELSVNKAYVKMLAKIKIVTALEAGRLLRGLDKIGKNWKPGDGCRYHDQYEDVHSFVQDQLEKYAGPAAKKIHTGRSRNDLVVTSTRLYVKSRLNQIRESIGMFQSALVEAGHKTAGAVIPGITHLKKAQPVLAAHHFLAYVEMLEEDADRLQDAGKRLDVLPLGSAALAGSSLPIDQKFLARELGFSKITPNSLAAVSDRAFLTEVLADLAILWTHLSRFSEDMVLWNSEPFHFIELDDAFATGSSLMPQKKNPDIFELTRGKSAAIFGDLMTLLALQKGLPLAYNRDLQEDKPAVFRALYQTLLVLEVLAPAVKTMRFHPGAMEAALQDDGLYATDLLEYLVGKKVPFREAHTAVGQAVRYASDHGISLRDLSLSTWQKFSKQFDRNVYNLFDPKKSVAAKKTIGSTHPARVQGELQKWSQKLKKVR